MPKDAVDQLLAEISAPDFVCGDYKAIRSTMTETEFKDYMVKEFAKAHIAWDGGVGPNCSGYAEYQALRLQLTELFGEFNYANNGQQGCEVIIDEAYEKMGITRCGYGFPKTAWMED